MNKLLQKISWKNFHGKWDFEEIAWDICIITLFIYFINLLF